MTQVKDTTRISCSYKIESLRRLFKGAADLEEGKYVNWASIRWFLVMTKAWAKGSSMSGLAKIMALAADEAEERSAEKDRKFLEEEAKQKENRSTTLWTVSDLGHEFKATCGECAFDASGTVPPIPVEHWQPMTKGPVFYHNEDGRHCLVLMLESPGRKDSERTGKEA